MTEHDMFENRKSKASHQALRKLADLIAGGDAAGFSQKEQLDLLRLTHELELAQVELEVQNEELRQTKRELEAAREEFRDLYESAPVAFLALSAKGIIERANAVARKMLAGPGMSLIGRAFSNFVLPEDRGIYFRDMKQIAVAENPSYFELRLVDAAAKPVHVCCQVSAKFDPEGGFSRWHLAFFDISERRRLQASLQKALEKSRQTNEELSEYVYAVTHDMKAPLRAVTNYADFLYEDLAASLSGEQKAYLNGMKKALAQGDALINDLLAFSSLGNAAPEADSVDVADLVSEIGELLIPPPEVEINVQPNWPQIRTDRSLLKQIMMNLIGNGIKFNRRNSKRIEIGWQPATDDHIEIFVRDNGIGIEPRYHEQIFRIFRRLHSDSKYEGTGIGLAIVQKSVRKLGGTVRLESVPGEGSTFYLNLPKSL